MDHDLELRLVADTKLAAGSAGNTPASQAGQGKPQPFCQINSTRIATIVAKNNVRLMCFSSRLKSAFRTTVR